ncbi:MAG: nickel pincer cofactor biosynthesis protein LarC [Lachnospiraceae bacterium]|nr:nickel pincer cofactor biosynthesis protein LarC [Lachnospiraceae bacterium]
MRTLYFDCSMGAAGDMLTAALYELLDDKESFIAKINGIGLEKVKIEPSASSKCGIVGTHMNVLIDGVSEEDLMHEHDHDHGEHHHDHDHEHHHDDHHHHASMADIESIINSLRIPEKVKEDSISVYKLIAEAESIAHGKEISEIHFHEVGKMDAVADVVSVCFLMNELKADKVIASPVNVGGGHVHCAHGILPVPAPATATILKEVPIYSGHIKSELCTPTGAALLKYFVNEFAEMPVMKVNKIGYGMGKKDFEQANCVRVMLGETSENLDTISELSCNVDDMTAERIAYASEKLFEAGALEVYTIPVGMKKSRPGILLCVMCREDKKEEIMSLIFKHTTTLGIRENISKRYILKREIIKKETPYGEVRIKRSEGYGIKRDKYEYEDLARIADMNDLSIEETVRMLDNM